MIPNRPIMAYECVFLQCCGKDILDAYIITRHVYNYIMKLLVRALKTRRVALFSNVCACVLKGEGGEDLP